MVDAVSEPIVTVVQPFEFDGEEDRQASNPDVGIGPSGISGIIPGNLFATFGVGTDPGVALLAAASVAALLEQ